MSSILVLLLTWVGLLQPDPLVLQSIQPSAVPEGSGAVTVMLKGSGFTASSIVNARGITVSGAPLMPVFIDETTLQVAIPSTLTATASTISLSVYDPSLSVLSREFLFYVYSTSPPVVTSMVPAGGLPATTTKITLEGMNLVGATMRFSGGGVVAVADTQNYILPPTRSNLQVEVAQDASFGTQAVTISTPSGSTTMCGVRSCTFDVVESGSWSHLPMPSLPVQPAVVRLLDGRVLVAGGAIEGAAVSSAQLFDASSGQWTAAASMRTARSSGVATLLPDGRVLVLGGFNDSGGLLAAEIYDPAADTWSVTGSMSVPPTGEPLLLPNGKVLIQRVTFPAFEAEIFDPVSGRFEPIPGLSFSGPRLFPTKMTLLSDGRVLIIGGPTNRIYDPVRATLSAVPEMNLGNTIYSARLLPNGRVLVRGAWRILLHATESIAPLAAIYDPKTNTVLPSSVQTSGADVLLPAGNVVIYDVLRLGSLIIPPFHYLGTAVLYDPVTDRALPQADDAPYVAPAYQLLDDGRALGVGSRFIQIYTPPASSNPAPVIGAVTSANPASTSEPAGLDIRGGFFLPNSAVQLGRTKLVTLYLGSQHLAAFVPSALRSSLNSGITVYNPGPAGGTTDAVEVGFRTAPLPIREVETGSIRTGYVIITPGSGTAAPISTLTYGRVRDGIVESQAGILPVPLTTGTAIMVDVLRTAGRNVGVALANPSGTAAMLTLTLRDAAGDVAASAVSISIPARSQITRFVTELFPSGVIGAAFFGSVTIQSSIPLSVIALRFSGAEFSTVPVPVASSAGVPQQSAVGGPNAVMFPQFAMSGGWATTLGLLNPGSTAISGRIDIFDTSGNPLTVTLNDESKSTFTYSIPARGSVLFAPRDSNGQSPF